MSMRMFFMSWCWLIVTVCSCFAQLTDIGHGIFDKFQLYTNTYNPKLLELYSEDAKIVREVIKPDGSTVKVNIPTKRFFQELKIGQKTAKLRKYKNKYRNISTSKIPNGIKISAERQPINENYWLKMYQVISETENGYKITEEMMQTKVQIFLKKQ